MSPSYEAGILQFIRSINFEMGVAGSSFVLGAGLLALIPTQIAGEDWQSAFHMSSPGFFPAVTGALLVTLGLIHGFNNLGKCIPPFERIETRPCFFGTATLLIAYYVAMGTIGTIVSSFLVVIIGPLVFGYRRWAVIIPSAVLAPTIIYLLFEKLLVIILPRGALF
jgi:hypothetical protein